jgi:hypothetical protein
MRTENRTVPRIAGTELDRTELYGSVLSVLVLWTSSEQNFCNTNPIKEAFSKIKHFLRHHQDYYLATTDDGILYDMYEVMDIITPRNAAGYYAHTGYFGQNVIEI